MPCNDLWLAAQGGRGGEIPPPVSAHRELPMTVPITMARGSRVNCSRSTLPLWRGGLAWVNAATRLCLLGFGSKEGRPARSMCTLGACRRLQAFGGGWKWPTPTRSKCNITALEECASANSNLGNSGAEGEYSDSNRRTHRNGPTDGGVEEDLQDQGPSVRRPLGRTSTHLLSC